MQDFGKIQARWQQTTLLRGMCWKETPTLAKGANAILPPLKNAIKNKQDTWSLVCKCAYSITCRVLMLSVSEGTVIWMKFDMLTEYKRTVTLTCGGQYKCPGPRENFFAASFHIALKWCFTPAVVVSQSNPLSTWIMSRLQSQAGN